ncbi:MAG: insulinase family protein [Clostridia bacterium]|nr:insulinase family protein [Clostridia bacterium]
MTVNRITAAPGAQLSVIPTDKFKSNYFALNFYLPLEKQSAGELSLLSRVMLRGTEPHPSIGELNRYTDMLYNLTFSLAVSAIGSVQTFSFRMDFLGDRFVPQAEKADILDSALDFAQEFFCRPLVRDGAFLSEYVESERKLLIDRIEGEINNKDRYAMRRGRMHLLGEHPAAISPNGDIETVSCVTGAQLYERFRSILVNAHAEALYVGEFSPDTEGKLLDVLRKILPENRVDAPMPETDSFKPASDGVGEIVEEAKTRQGRMVLGYSLPYTGEESPVANAFIEIFSASPVSRLFANVREKLNLCYYCSASMDFSLGIMTVMSGISEKNVEKARAEISRQLNGMASGDVSDTELDRARSAIVSSIKTLKDTPSSLGEWYLRRIVQGAPSDIDALMDGVGRVSAEQVAEFASRARLCMAYFLRGTDE